MSKQQQIQDILKLYEEASRQILNKQKTSSLFSANASQMVWNQILQMAGVAEFHNQDKYLGLPAIAGKDKNKTFQKIKDKVWERVKNWKNHFLSQAGKEILLKAVVQAISTYSMSVFLLPKGVCKEIASIMVKF